MIASSPFLLAACFLQELCCHWRNKQQDTPSRQGVDPNSEPAQCWQAEARMENISEPQPSTAPSLLCPSTSNGVARNKQKASKETLLTVKRHIYFLCSTLTHREATQKTFNRYFEPEERKKSVHMSRIQECFTKALKSGNHAVHFLLFFMNTQPILPIHALGFFLLCGCLLRKKTMLKALLCIS